MSVQTIQNAGMGRRWRQQTARLVCDGNEQCRLSTPIESTTGAEARAFARQQGWRVNVKHLGSRQRLDYCPEHRNAGRKP